MVRELIADHGAIPYVEVVELALYHPEHGFYSGHGQAGRRGDFLTSVEVGPLFGKVIASALDTEWDRLGQPEVFTIVDYGAGPGTLARSIVAAKPRCERAMRYIALERSAAQRLLHPEAVLSTDDLASVGNENPVGVVIANELLDNLAFTPVSRVGEAMHRLDVVTADDGRLTSAVGQKLANQDAFAPNVASAFVQDKAAAWLAFVTGYLARGRVIVLDYARRSSAEVEVRTYAAHGPAGDPLESLGSKDITIDVDLEQLQQRVRPADDITTQADWLRQLGIEKLVEEGRSLWEANAASGGIPALTARSRIREAEALLDPYGLGGFLVAEWVIEPTT